MTDAETVAAPAPTAAEAPAADADHAPLLERLFARVPDERAYRITEIDGELPGWLRGTYLVNGPARFRRGATVYRHWLDGDGMVCALRFDDDGVRFANRFVRSEKLAAEEAAGRAIYRTFGTTFRGDELIRGIALASPVNVSVYPCCGHLLAFGEQGLPWALDRESLETLGPHTFGGRLNPVSPFAAHPNLDRRTGEVLNFGVSFSAARPVLHLYRFAADGALVYRRRHDLDAPRSVHDFGLSERRSVFFLSPYLLDMERFAAGGSTLLDCLSWEPERGSLLRVFDREDGSEVASLPIGEGYCLHLINCFDRDDGRLVVDLVELEEPVYPDYLGLPDMFTEVRPGVPVRRVVDLERGEVVERREVDYRRACDFPSVAPGDAFRSYDDFWLLGISKTGLPGRKFFDEVIHARWSTGRADDVWRAPRLRYLGGEPVVATDPDDEERAVVFVQELDAGAETAAILLFDARRVAGGPIARLPLRSPIPPLFHAHFEPSGARAGER